MNKHQQKAVEHALKYLEQRQELYAGWNTLYDALPVGEHRVQELRKQDERIANYERHAVIELHNLLFAFGVVDKPMAS